MKNALYSLLFATAMLFPLTSCKLNQSQGLVIAQNAGLASAVTWIAYDNPTADETALVKSILTVIQTVSTGLKEGETYTQVLFPVVENTIEKYVVEGKIKPNEKPLATAGSLAILNGIDLLFATNPSWSDNEEYARKIVDSFLTGANTGLSLADNDPRMVSARQSNARRARVFIKSE